MTLKVIGAGIGRTGTYSLRIALNRLGFGPCYHMEEVLLNMPSQLPLWQDAVRGSPNWAAVFKGYQSAVDWPTARFFRELNAEYPDAKFILGYRSPRSWAESFSQTIYQLLSGVENAPENQREWLAMVTELISQNGIPPGLDVAGLENAFTAHAEAVKAEIPAARLLVFEAKDGWEPLCAFLGVPVPDEPFPRTNNRTEFWELVKGAS
ncbi:sulfotransferase family protein [Leisingera thetidis]|uniref:sulfotransferase family protein n=1 Tax=Leisingera thetidis TaxID=2930199 RepID=UPI0021F75DDD|nr:sulfotransferase family protein [Leisingera thetidis]